MPHLTSVPDPDPAAYFTSIPVCPACPPDSLGFNIDWAKEDWEVTLWHTGLCPQSGDAPALIHVPGCAICHTWGHTDLSPSALVPGQWTFIPTHGRTPLTSRDGTIATASGGEYCPQMEPDNAFIGRLGRPQQG